MPTISVNRDILFDYIGQKYSDKDFDELCFEFGIELDDVVVEKVGNGPEETTTTVYKIEIPANRYDLLCVEGLGKALSIFLNKSTPPDFKLVVPPANEIVKLNVMPNCATVRPYAVAAILRNISFNKQSYDSFIELQDKLHQNLCRKRTLVAIGTHDLDTIKGPFTYDARKPEDIKFRPLSQKNEYTAAELMDLYSKDSHLKAYLPIIQHKEFYPVITDSNNIVLSLPPIINGEHSKITLSTKNVFIECTATDLHKAQIVLDTMVTMFSEYCAPKFQIEAVQVTQLDGKTRAYPTLEQRFEIVETSAVNKKIGIEIGDAQMAQLLKRMGLPAEVVEPNKLKVKIVPTRSDVLHVCDIIEDVAIGYGYNNIVRTIPKTNCFSSEFELNKLTDLLRLELAQCGYTEALTFTLCSKEDVSTKLGKTIESVPAVHISNPKTLDFQVARTSLLPGLLKTLASSRNMPLPLKIFEVSDVVLNDKTAEVGARNERRLCVVAYNKQSGFEIAHGVLDRMMQVLNVPWKTGYSLKHIEDPTYMPGRCAAVHLANGTIIGTLGVLHPDVIHNFELNLPCSALEINIEPFL